MSDIKVALVCIAKNELLYIKEFINYYLKLGFYRIIIYDNSDNNELLFLNSPKVCVIPFPGLAKQIPAYNHFLRNLKNQYDYAAFFDVDEFLVLKKHKNINEFCLEIIPDGAIGINWYIFGNNGNTRYDPKPVVQRFIRRNSKMDIHVKTIGKCNNLISMNVHHPTELSQGSHFKNLNNNIISGPHNHNLDDSIAQLNHYLTKSNEELLSKIKRGRADIIVKRKLNELDPYLNFNDVEDTFARDFYLQ